MILLLLNGLSEAVLRALFWYTIQACTLFNHSVYAGMIMVLPVVLKALGNNNFTQEGGGGGGGCLGQFSLGMCRWPLRTPTHLKSI